MSNQNLRIRVTSMNVNYANPAEQDEISSVLVQFEASDASNRFNGYIEAPYTDFETAGVMGTEALVRRTLNQKIQSADETFSIRVNNLSFAYEGEVVTHINAQFELFDTTSRVSGNIQVTTEQFGQVSGAEAVETMVANLVSAKLSA